MKSIDLVRKYYQTSGLEIPKPIQELIDEITRLSPCEQEGYRQEIARLKGVVQIRTALNKSQGKAIKRLLKEKEWLIDKYTQAQYLTGLEMRKKRLLQDMQQELKDKS